MTENKIFYLSKADVASTGLGMAEIIQLVEQAFKENSNLTPQSAPTV